MTGALRRLFLWLLRVYYPDIGLRGLERAPTGPLLVVANHPNGLLDPVVLCVALGRPVTFLAKSTLFDTPVLRQLVRAFDAVPVYRAKEADTSHNDRTFALCRAQLAAGAAVCLFPEGTSHSAPKLAPLKTGAARLALTMDAAVPLLPVGLAYEAKATFRSRAAVTIGQPIDLAPFRTMDDSQAAARALTARIADELGQLVLQSDDSEMWHGFRAVAGWLGEAGEDLAVREARARSLAGAWEVLRRDDPLRAESLADEARRFARTLSQAGVDDPLSLRAGPQRLPSALAALLPLAALAPLALIGMLWNVVPYRIVGAIASRVAGEELDVVGTYKMLLGVVVLPLWWLATAALTGWSMGWPLAMASALVGPLGGWVALRWSERWLAYRTICKAGWLALTRRHLVEAVEQHRRSLATAVAGLLDTAGGPVDGK
jgi:1-acyl-sn-glycerol-3-phosphate acyltransferase